MSEPKNVHAGHREKLRKKFLKNKDFSNMEEHEILELLLFYALPRVNTNIIAHELINECRGLDRVFTAPREQLKAVDGVGDKVCDYIDILSAFVRYCNSYEVTDMSKLKSDNVIKYFKNLFYGRQMKLCI